MSRPPLPEQGERPYQYRFSPRNIGSDVVRGALLPGFVNLIDRFSGGNIRSGVDRMFGGVQDRMYNDEASYMRNMLNQDARAMQPSFLDRLREALGRNRTERPPMPQGAETFGIGPDAQRAQVLPNVPQGPGGVVMDPYSTVRDSWDAGSGYRQDSRIGPGQGTTIASGRAAQNMFEGMRAGANANMTRTQARNAMSNMFMGEEK